MKSDSRVFDVRVPELEKFVDDGGSIMIEATFGRFMRGGNDPCDEHILRFISILLR